MAIKVGSSLGTYEILAAIGKGGMGEVYRARDLKLKREVAIKSLPDAFARDPGRLARFQREAEALAALNHKHIASIYGVEESGGVRFLVLELVEGETLEERLRLGAMPVDEVMRLALQIAEGLEAAHEKGFVHRDLKPGNIKITPEGQIKVLDFGLARSDVDEVPASSLSNSPTLSAGATGEGVILGTAAYMSPEQAKGRKVDKRSDIFSFGCVLYEMLTGRQTFGGEDLHDILSRVLQREPDWASLPPGVPARIQTLLRLCLEKDIKKRRRDMGDVRIDIEQALNEPASSPAVSAARTPSSRLAWIVAGVLVLITVGALALALRRAPEAPEMRVEIGTPATQQPLHFAISPDGTRLVFVASGDGAQRLWLRPLDAVASQPLESTEGAEFPFWSPDNRSIGFFASGKLKRIDIGAGSPQILADAATGRGGAWSRDGTILFAPTNSSPLLRVPASGGQPVPATKLGLPRQGSHRLPQFLPDSQHFLFFAQGNTEGQGIYLGSLENGETKRLTPADAQGAYTEPALVLYLRQETLVAQSLDVTSGALKGDPIALADRVGHDSGFNVGGFSVSATGRIVYRPGGSERRQLTWFDRTGRMVGVAGEPDFNSLGSPELSPDGRRVAVNRTVQNNLDVWLIDLVRGGSARFTFDAAQDFFPIWSPDGMRIAFGSNRKGSFDLYLKPSTGIGSEELLLESPHVKDPMDWSADGSFLLYFDADPKTGWDLWALPMKGDRKPIVVANTPFDELGSQFSPDGRWVAYQSNETGRNEIYVQPFPGPGGKSQISTAGGTLPRWRADGKELFFIAPDAKLMAAPVQGSGSTFEAGSPVALFQTRMALGGAANVKQQYAVSRDGRFLINMPVESVTPPITLLLNWKPK